MAIFVTSAVRTAVGSFGGALKNVPPTELGMLCARAAIERAGADAEEVGSSVFGNVIQTDADDLYMGRAVGRRAGLADQATGLTVNRLCGSGLQAILTAAGELAEGAAELALAGGAESMSRAPFTSSMHRFGRRLGHDQMTDMLLAALNDPFGHGHMGETAENVAERFGITRAEQDAYAAESHARAARAIDAGRFDDQIVPVPMRKGAAFARDEHVRPETTAAALAELKPAFRSEGTVTAGNASGINDGAAALLLASEGALQRLPAEPLARLVTSAVVGVDPSTMGLGPVPAVRRVLERARLSIDEIDVIESNEAFAAQALAVARELAFPPERTNPNGGAIALGHPVGASGAIITVKALHELRRIRGRYALVTLCIGGGQGIAALFEAP